MLQTVDADAKMEAECLPVCGSLSCFAAAADVEMVLAAVSAAMTAACGSSYFCAAAAEMCIRDRSTRTTSPL